MNFKIGDKVKMTKEGFLFYSNIDTAYDMASTSMKVESSNFERAICTLFSIHGIGTVKKINSCGDLYIRWNYRLDGVKYYSEHYYEQEEVSKLSFLDKIKFKLQGRV